MVREFFSKEGSFQQRSKEEKKGDKRRSARRVSQPGGLASDGLGGRRGLLCFRNVAGMEWLVDNHSTKSEGARRFCKGLQLLKRILTFVTE